MKHCQNPKCREQLSAYNGGRLCPACRYLARWMFAGGAGLVGVVAGLLKLIRWLS